MFRCSVRLLDCRVLVPFDIAFACRRTRRLHTAQISMRRVQNSKINQLTAFLLTPIQEKRMPMDLWHVQVPHRSRGVALRPLRTLCGFELQSSLWGVLSRRCLGELSSKALTNAFFLVWIKAAFRVFVFLPCDAYSLPFRNKFGV